VTSAARWRTAVHGMGRIGEGRALKWALESYWAGRSSADELEATGAAIRRANWRAAAAAGIDFIPSNDFSLYDHVLDAAVMTGALPARLSAGAPLGLDAYFALARGGTVGGRFVAPLELTKWFDTNYHHLVPEVGPATAFRADPSKARAELAEAAGLGIETTPVLLGPCTLLLRSSTEEPGVAPARLVDRLVDVYAEVLAALAGDGAAWAVLDEPALVEDRSTEELDLVRRAYERLGERTERPMLALSTYFGHVGEAMPLLASLPVEGIGLDFCRGPENLELLEAAGGLGQRVCFAGVVDGRNVWVNDLERSLALLARLAPLAREVVVSTSCSLLHVPLGLRFEPALDEEVRPLLAFAEEKLVELGILARGAAGGAEAIAEELAANRALLEARRRSPRIVDPALRRRIATVEPDPRRSARPEERAAAQRARLGLAPLPTTTIGSFPQTQALRALRASWRAGATSDDEYRRALRAEIDRVVALQEEIGLDVLVHGEPERDDMVRYFAERLDGFVLPAEGWVQSYGSRCVRPPVLFGEVRRAAPITLEWTRYAQSRTSRPVKGMLTGPVTMLRWSFVREDQPESDTALQLALALRDELVELEAAGTAVIQVDEPALREGLPLRAAARPAYLAWATRAFRTVVSPAGPATQVHTHMCYAQLGDILDALADLEVDVVSLEAARSKMALVGELAASRYAGGVGPGVYDVHSPRVPEAAEIAALLRSALERLRPERLWVNPDCGLKTRRYEEVEPALRHLVAAAATVRAELAAQPTDGRAAAR